MKEIDVNIPRTSERTLSKVLRAPDYCIGERDHRPIKRKQEIEKLGGYDASKRLAYCKDGGELHQYIQKEAIIVVADEKKFSFGGTTHRYVSMPVGEDSYGTVRREQFVREQ